MTTVIDLPALYYAQGARPQDLARNVNVTDDGNGGVYEGFTGVADLAVKAAVSKSSARGTITVKLQDSADGTTGWADICTVGALTSSNAHATVLAGAAPREFVRALWTTAGSPKKFSLSVSVVPVGLVPAT